MNQIEASTLANIAPGQRPPRSRVFWYSHKCSIAVGPDTFHAIESIASNHGVKRSQVIRVAIEHAIKCNLDSQFDTLLAEHLRSRPFMRKLYEAI